MATNIKVSHLAFQNFTIQVYIIYIYICIFYESFKCILNHFLKLENAPGNSKVIFLLMSPTSDKTKKMADTVGLWNPCHLTSNHRSFSSAICPNGCLLLLDEPWTQITCWSSI